MEKKAKLPLEDFFSARLKEQSNEIFDPQFFSSFEPVWATDQWVKIFSILFQISLSYSKFKFEKTDSPGYYTPGSHPRTMVQKRKM